MINFFAPLRHSSIPSVIVRQTVVASSTGNCRSVSLSAGPTRVSEFISVR